MKNLSLLFVFLFCVPLLSAQNTLPYCHSSLSIDLPNNNRYEIFIDGENYGFLDRGIIHNIYNGKRFVQIVEKANYRGGENKAITFFMVFNECQDVFTRLDSNGKITVLNAEYKEDISNHEQFEIIYIYNEPNEIDDTQNTTYTQPEVGIAPPPIPPQPQPDNYPPPPPNYPNDNRPMPMSEASFQSFIQSVESMSHDYSKQEIAEMGISSNLFTSAQVLELLRLFSYDYTKLSIAKMAFHKTVDPENYTLLFPVFSHDYNKQDLSKYIRRNF